MIMNSEMTSLNTPCHIHTYACFCFVVPAAKKRTINLLVSTHRDASDREAIKSKQITTFCHPGHRRPQPLELNFTDLHKTYPSILKARRPTTKQQDWCFRAASNNTGEPRRVGSSVYKIQQLIKKSLGFCSYCQLHWLHSIELVKTRLKIKCVTDVSLNQQSPWSRVVLERLLVTQMAKKFLAFYGTRRFITVFTTARQCTLSWATWIQSTSHTVFH